jgi:hypothetical protein
MHQTKNQINNQYLQWMLDESIPSLEIAMEIGM